MAVCAAHPGPDKASPSGAPARDRGTEAAHRAWSRQPTEGGSIGNHFINEQGSWAVLQMNEGGVVHLLM